MKRAALLGATGVVGRELLELLLEDHRYGAVNVIARRSTRVQHAKLHEFVTELASMHDHSAAFDVDEIFCALGTTIRAAGSQEAFREVDHAHVLRAAKLGREHGVPHFLLVSSLGANPASRLFYSRVKGEVERDVAELGYPQLTIARPSFLDGRRTERRLGEEIVKRLGWLMPLSSRPIEPRTVARALVRAANESFGGVRLLLSQEMQAQGVSGGGSE